MPPNNALPPRDYLTPAQIQKMIDDTVKRELDTLHASAREGGTLFAMKIDEVRKALEAKCDADLSDEIDGLQLPKDDVALLDKLRASAPTVYALLVQAAQDMVDGDPITRNARASASMDHVLAALAPSSSSKTSKTSKT